MIEANPNPQLAAGEDFAESGALAGLPYETHRSGWYPWEFGRRCRVHRWSVFPGHFTKHLRLPRLWQLLLRKQKKVAFIIFWQRTTLTPFTNRA